MALHSGVESEAGPVGDAVERWLPIPGVPEGRYEISSLGRMRRLARVVQTTDGRTMRMSDKEVEGHPLPDGHIRASIQLDRQKYAFLVHRAVLHAFVRPPEEGEKGLHRNGLPHDNRLENLYWGTDKDNAEDRSRHRDVPKTCQRGHFNWYVNPRTRHRQCKDCVEMSRARRDRLKFHGPLPERVSIEGSRNVMAKLTEEQVREIKGQLAAGIRQQALADMYGVSRGKISHINTGRAWKHVT